MLASCPSPNLLLDNFESPAQNKSAFPSEQVEAGHRSSPTSVLDRSKSLPRDSSTSLPENDLELGRRPSRKAKEGKTYHNLYLSREFNKSLNGRIIKNGARKSVGSARVKDPSSSTQKKDDGSTKPLMTSPEIFVTPRKSSPQPQRLNSTKRTRTRTPDSMASEDMISPGPKLKEKKRRRTDSGERKGLLSEFQGVSSGL
ncbi:hypothetical protein P152DRAFT_144864 [Eremomyces bilateralis CBS 781.70]|uniref:Uncharacterized protein n=1 Tax=Eremomyces bilateralis CBS 781.70 TaxID=1392243 RepID=A0A6G1FVX7_9PEZI|nr:uncharacterized protein P152DRAFT_144864 [Eremomyces bilateralis CBS 781.70]KAF1809987.1 hypothetical protein P152DRAFT_144864 [Eremomyces bilateralis CBS 781.70]